MKLLNNPFLVKFLCCLSLLLFLSSCTKTKQEDVKTLFSLVNNNQTNIQFVNVVKENLYFNFLNYPYIYNGGGVAVGDINNDGLEDIYFTSNQESNKLYLNQDNFKFKDITESANVNDNQGWSTGATMIDINNDGWLDIYVCKSGSLDNHDKRKNKLFINQKNNTFTESAEQYGIDFYGFSIQSHFFDMDNDGDLDLYLVNHRIDFRNNVTLDLNRDKQIDDYGSDQLYRNDLGKFINITNTSGIANKAWGLSASIGDYNNDGWQDVFVANDFFHSDYLYINNKNGTFTDQALQMFKHMSNSSMGSDFEDLNNDLLPDLVVLDMLAEDHIRAKKNMAAMNTNSFNMMVNSGYHHQYMTNVLQLNNGNGSYSDIAQLSGISKTDWSWAPLIADFDNDGYKDIFITNGIENDLSNQDYRDQMRQNIMDRKKVSLEEAIAMMPSDKLQNYAFKNNGDLTFSKISDDWGITQKINSNGAAYSDLDNDGDLDLVINNQSEKASIYMNNATNNHISFKLKGPKQNTNGIGAKVYVYAAGLQQVKHLNIERGYQSSVTQKLHFGLGNNTKIDSIRIVWPDNKSQLITKGEINSTIVLNYNSAKISNSNSTKKAPLFTTINPKSIGIDYKQVENDVNDFDIQLLLPQKQSEISSALAVADVNNDGLDDMFIGNARGASAVLYIQNNRGHFYKANTNLFEKDRDYEDTNAEFLDIDNDNDLDLYVTSGGYELDNKSNLLQDRLYINNGKGDYTKSNRLPKILSNTKGITTIDYDGDGDLDLFVGGRTKPGKYPLSDDSYLLENTKGKFTNVTEKVIPEIADANIINDAVTSDFDNDGDQDLIIVGEWMPITFYENVDKRFIKKSIDGLDISGWHQTIAAADLDNDKDTDYIIGNWGTNNKFKPSKKKPLHIYADYFDENSTFDLVLSKVSKNGDLIPVRGKECSSEQTPFLKDKIKTYQAFASSTLPEIYGENLLNKSTHYTANNFKSIVLKNLGNGNFKVEELPPHAQFSPTLSIETHDFNKDGILDIFGVGNIYEAEVETVRYDASQGYVLNNSIGETYTFVNDTSYLNNNEARIIKKIIIDNQMHFIIINKNGAPKILKYLDK